MASRYWVGGTGNWDASNTTNWSTTSGGSGGASVPTSSDDVIFDQNSSTANAAYTVTMTATGNCLDFTMDGPHPSDVNKVTFAGSSSWNIAGSVNFTGGTAGITYTKSGTNTFTATTTGKTVTMNGISWNGPVVFNGVGGGWTLQDTYTGGSSNLTLTAGSLDTNSQAVNGLANLIASGSSVRSLTLGSSTISVSQGFNFATTTNLTFNAGTSTIAITGGGSTIQPGGLTFYNLTRTTGSGFHDSMTVSGGNITVSNTLTLNGFSSAYRLFIKSDTFNTQRTITAATVTMTCVDLQDIVGAGAGSWNLASITGGSGDCGGNSGITFTTPTTTDCSAGTAFTSGTWSIRVPLPQDTATFSGSGRTITQDLPRIGTVDFTGSSGLTFTPSTVASVYGSINLTNLGTLTASTEIYSFLGRGSYTINSGGKTWGKAFVFDTISGTYTLTGTLNLNNGNAAITLTSGTFDTNGQTVTALNITSNGSATRALSFGASTLNLSNSISLSAVNLTFNAGTSMISITNGSTTFGGAGFTFYDVTILAQTTFTGTNSFRNLTLSSFGNVSQPVTLGANQTISGTFTANGNSAVNRILVQSDTFGTQRTITAATVSASNIDFQDIIGAGAGSWNLASSSSGDCGGNSGITFTTPGTQYMKTGTSNNWNAAIWFTTSGGSTPGRVPLPQDTAIIDANSITAGSVTITQNMPRVGSMDWTGVTNSPTLALSTACSIFGSVTLVSGMSLSGTVLIRFRGRGTVNITSGGKTWLNQIAFETIGGSIVLQDNFINSNASIPGVNYGTFDANNFNVTANGFNSNGSNTRTVTMGSGTWTLTGNGTLWNFTTVTGLTFNANTSTIKLTDSSSSAKTFAGGGLTYNNFWNATGSTGTVTISGNNTFNDHKIDAGRSQIFTSGTIQRITTLTAVGTAGNIITLTASSAGTQFYLSDGSGTNTCDYLSVKDAYVGGGATFTAGANSTFVSNNSGWSDLTISSRYWVTGGTGNWSSTTNWSTTSGGSSGASVPTVSNDVYFDGNSGSGTSTIDATTLVNKLDFNGFTGTFAGGSLLTVYGDLRLSSGMTIANTNTISLGMNFTSRTITSNGKTFNRALTIGLQSISSPYFIDTWTLQDDLSIESVSQLTLTNGGFNANNHNVTCGAFSSTNTNYRSITMGSGTWTLNGIQSTSWSTAITTNLTFNAGTSTIKMTAATTGTRSFSGGGMTFNNFWINNSLNGTINLLGSNTFNDFKCDSGGQTIQFTAATTNTLTTWSVNGTMGNPVVIKSITNAVHNLVKAGGGTISGAFLTISYSTVTPSSTWTATNSTDGGNNTGWTFLSDPIPYPAFLLQIV